MNRNSATLYFRKLRELIACNLAHSAPDLAAGEIDVDAHNFDGVWWGKSDYRVAGKVPIFAFIKRNDYVHALSIPNNRSAMPVSMTRRKIQPDSIVFMDGYRDNNIVDLSALHQVWINREELFEADHGPINEIEVFWNNTKRHLSGYNGIPRQHFHLYLMECEWRFNHHSLTSLEDVLLQWMKI